MTQTVQNIATIKLNNHAGSLKPLSEDKENTLKHDLIQDYTALIQNAFFKDAFKSPLQSNLAKMHINISITKKNITVTNRDTNAKIQLPVIQEANTLKMNQIISDIFRKATTVLRSSNSPSADQSAPAAQTSPVTPTFTPSHRLAPLKIPSPIAAKRQDTVKSPIPIFASTMQKTAALSSSSPSPIVFIEDPQSATAIPLSPDPFIFESPKSTMPISPRSPDQEDLAPLSPMKPMGETQVRETQTPASPRDINLDLSPLPIHPLSPMKRSEGLEEPLSPLGMMISSAFKSAQQASATTPAKAKLSGSDAPKLPPKIEINPKPDTTRTFKPTESVLKTHKQRRQPDSTFTKKPTSPIFSLTPFIPKGAVKLTAPHPFSVNSKESMSPTPSSSRSRSDQEFSPIVAEDFLRDELELDDNVTRIHLAPGQPNLMISTPQTKNPKSNTTKTKTEKTWIKRIGSIFKSNNPTTSTTENHKPKTKTNFFKRLISKTSQKTPKKEPIPQPASDINEELDITYRSNPLIIDDLAPLSLKPRAIPSPLQPTAQAEIPSTLLSQEPISNKPISVPVQPTPTDLALLRQEPASTQPQTTFDPLNLPIDDNLKTVSSQPQPIGQEVSKEDQLSILNSISELQKIMIPKSGLKITLIPV